MKAITCWAAELFYEKQRTKQTKTDFYQNTEIALSHNLLAGDKVTAVTTQEHCNEFKGLSEDKLTEAFDEESRKKNTCVQVRNYSFCLQRRSPEKIGTKLGLLLKNMEITLSHNLAAGDEVTAVTTQEHCNE